LIGAGSGPPRSAFASEQNAVPWVAHGRSCWCEDSMFKII
jgi:hypothetical protein